MKKVAKSILTGLGALLVLLGILVLLINIYLQSAAVQNKIQRSLGKAFGMPVEIRTISFTPPGGLKLSGIAVPSENPDRPDFIQSAAVTVRFRLSPLFRRRFVIQEVSVHNPNIHWQQSPLGKWQTPQEPVAPAIPSATPPEASAPPALPPEPTAPAPDRPAAPMPTPSPNEPHFEVQVQHFSIHNGDVALRDRDGDPLATFLDIDISSDWTSKHVAVGEARSYETRIADRLLLRKLQTNFRYSAADLQLSEVTAKVGSGTLEGEFKADLDKADLPYKVHARFSDVELSKLIEDAGGNGDQVSGKLTGELQLRGRMRNRNRTEGRGHLSVKGGSFRQYGILQMIGEQLRIRELSELKLDQASADFRVAKGKVRVDDLVLKSPNIEIRAKGTVKLDGRLDLDARLTINDRISRQLPGFIEDNFTKIDDGDLRYVDFDITGTLENPDTELMRVLLWKRHEDAAKQLFKKIFGGQ